MVNFFINRPIVAIVISIIIVIVGIVSVLGLPVAQYPDIVPPEILIDTTYVGADAQTLDPVEAVERCRENGVRRTAQGVR